MASSNIFDQALAEPTSTDPFSSTALTGQSDLFASVLGGDPKYPAYFNPSVANSWGNRFAIATDQMQKSMYQGLGVKKNHVKEALKITKLEEKDIENCIN